MAKWFGLGSKVEIEGGRSAREAQQALAGLTGGVTSFAGRKRKPFIGWIRGDEGKLWLCRFYNNAFALRSVRFRLLPAVGDGCSFQGKLRPTLPVYLVFGFALLFGMLIGSRIFLGFGGAAHGSGAWGVCFIPLLIVSVYMFFFWIHGRKAEALCIKAIRHTLADEKSAAVVADLLALD